MMFRNVEKFCFLVKGRLLIFRAMKFQKGQTVILLTIDGKPANGKAIVEEVDEQNELYTVRHYLTDAAPAELISRVPEGRLLTLRNIEVR